MVRTQIQLTESQAERLKQAAVREGVSMAALIRRGVDSLLASNQPISRSDRRRRALAAVGRFSSREGDLSGRHDEYFADAAGADETADR